jgi:large-conductance mechanosensitive channel
MMSSVLIWRNFAHGRAPDFAVGVLMGSALTMMIVGLVKQRRGNL